MGKCSWAVEVPRQVSNQGELPKEGRVGPLGVMEEFGGGALGSGKREGVGWGSY